MSKANPEGISEEFRRWCKRPWEGLGLDEQRNMRALPYYRKLQDEDGLPTE